ncbi:hypothetical protein [Streptomyces sp. NPDC008125]|uniref:hypothetical protein n=1 Tax=Streptomyces sp. NPDC008125 TaxID=3364811 RepID=UPI0036ED8A8F
MTTVQQLTTTTAPAAPAAPATALALAPVPVPLPAPTTPAPAVPFRTAPSWMIPAVLAAVLVLLLAGVVLAIVVHLWPGALVPVTVIGTVCTAAGSLAGVVALARRP